MEKNYKEHLDRVMEIHEIYKEKNAKYGSSFDRSLDKYGLVAWQVRNEDKMNRLETLLGDLLKKNVDGKYVLENGLEDTDESIHDTLMDAAGYIVMLDMWLSSVKETEEFKVYASNKLVPRNHKIDLGSEDDKYNFQEVDVFVTPHIHDSVSSINRLTKKGVSE